MEPLVPDSVAVHPGCLLVKLGQVAFRLTENRLAPLGMRTRHYTLLKVLVAEGPLSQSELGRRSRIDPTTVVAVIDELEGKEFATRTRDATDRRRSLVVATDAGRLAAAEADALLDGLGAEMFADLTDDQTRDLAGILGAINAGAALSQAAENLRV